ncbi:hypothetical protein AABM34_13075 [Lysinibacillus fusiformis]
MITKNKKTIKKIIGAKTKELLKNKSKLKSRVVGIQLVILNCLNIIQSISSAITIRKRGKEMSLQNIIDAQKELVAKIIKEKGWKIRI